MAEYVCELPIEGMASFVSGGTVIPVYEEIVRCRDCKRYEWRGHLGRSYCHGEYPTEPDGFCKWGERREDA